MLSAADRAVVDQALRLSKTGMLGDLSMNIESGLRDLSVSLQKLSENFSKNLKQNAKILKKVLAFFEEVRYTIQAVIDSVRP